MAAAQNDSWLHARIAGRVYQDDRISVRVPPGWSVAIDNEVGGPERGAILRKGKYTLRLCTGCAQVSGIAGGRFSEISAMVQPWYRMDPGAKPMPCGVEEKTRTSEMLNRIDFLYRRDPAHPYREDFDDCREPSTNATVWYGSYFEENCSGAGEDAECGGYFLHRPWLAAGPACDSQCPPDEMAFALTYDTANLDRLPHKNDPELNRVLGEASAIVKSVLYKRD
jgi:hypothetical protein